MGIYRKSSLEKLSSPEQLDRMIVITSPTFWIAVAGAVLITVVALIWSIVGRLPEKITGNGIYVSENGIHVLYADTSGTVATVETAVGDTVKNGTVVLSVADGDEQDKLAQVQQKIDSVNAVTLDSVDDVATADNKALLDVKVQLTTLQNQLKADQRSLSDRQADYTGQKAQLDSLKAAADNAKSIYYSSINVTQDNSYQQKLTDAQTAASTKQSYYENAVSSYRAALSQYEVAMQSASAYLAGVLNSTNAAAATSETAAAENAPLIAQLTAYQRQFADATAQIHAAVVNANPVSVSIGSADVTSSVFANAMSFYVSLTNDSSTLATAWTGVRTARDAVTSTSSALDDAKKAYEDAKSSYDSYSVSQGSLTQAQQKLQNEYQLATTSYNTQLSAVKSMESTIDQLKTTVQNDQQAITTQKEQIRTQFDAAKGSTLDGLTSQRDELLKNLDKTSVEADADGLVTEISVQAGAIITQGTELMKITPNANEAAKNIIVCYIPVASGKKVTAGMKVMVYPTTVNKQEYGHMEATVVNVDHYVASTADMKNLLGSDSLVNSFSQSGPVVAVTCQLREDPATASGYYWSSKKGSKITLTVDTMVSADIVTAEKAPISMLIPLLKEKLTITAASSSAAAK